MDLDILVSTMFDDINLYHQMNLQSNAIIINQTDHEESIKTEINKNKIKFISTTDRGLAKSRNLAIRESNADICMFTDNDVVFNSDYKSIILNAYKEYPDADIIAFTVTTSDTERKMNKLKTGKVNRIKSMKISSVQISFKREAIYKNNLYLNEKFGAGSNYFNSGEENIFLYQAIKKGLKMYYVDKEIADVTFEDSTWHGKDIEQDLLTKGAMFYEMSSLLYPIYIFQFALRKRPIYEKKFKFLEAVKIMLKGSKEVHSR